jgi:hypothetical protein
VPNLLPGNLEDRTKILLEVENAFKLEPFEQEEIRTSIDLDSTQGDLDAVMWYVNKASDPGLRQQLLTAYRSGDPNTIEYWEAEARDQAKVACLGKAIKQEFAKRAGKKSAQLANRTINSINQEHKKRRKT